MQSFVIGVARCVGRHSRSRLSLRELGRICCDKAELGRRVDECFCQPFFLLALFACWGARACPFRHTAERGTDLCFPFVSAIDRRGQQRAHAPRHDLKKDRKRLKSMRVEILAGDFYHYDLARNGLPWYMKEFIGRPCGHCGTRIGIDNPQAPEKCKVTEREATHCNALRHEAVEHGRPATARERAGRRAGRCPLAHLRDGPHGRLAVSSARAGSHQSGQSKRSPPERAIEDIAPACPTAHGGSPSSKSYRRHGVHRGRLSDPRQRRGAYACSASAGHLRHSCGACL